MVRLKDSKLAEYLKSKGINDLELQIEILKKEIDTLKTIIDIKDVEIESLKEDIKNQKWLGEVANNTPNSSQFD